MPGRFDDLQTAALRVQAAEAALGQAGAMMNSEVVRLAMMIREDARDAREARSFLYWETGMAGEDLAMIFGVAKNQLRTVVNPRALDRQCPRCGEAFLSLYPSRASFAANAKKIIECGFCVENAEKQRIKAAEAERARLRTVEYLRSISYKEYLQTDHWRETRAKARAAAGERCQVCSSCGPLDVHHRTYERRGCELPQDLTVLCRECHETFHTHRQLAKSNV